MATIKLSYKLMGGFIITLLVVGLIGLYVQGVEADRQEEVLRNLELLKVSESLALYQSQMVVAAKSHILSRTEYENQQSISDFFQAYNGTLRQLQLLESHGASRYSIDIVRTYLELSKKDFGKLASVYDAPVVSGDSVTIHTNKEMLNVLMSIEDSNVKIAGAREMIILQANNALADSVAQAETERQNSTSLIVVATAFSIGLVIFITQSATRQISELQRGVNRISSGDLDVRISIHTHDELGDVAEAFNKMAENLKKSTVGIKELDLEVAKRTRELASKNADLERFNRLSVGRELKMVDLKEKIINLKAKLAEKK